MKVTILHAYISDGKVVAQDDSSVYVYKHELSEKNTQKLLDMLGKTSEINTEHWDIEWEKSACGS